MTRHPAFPFADVRSTVPGAAWPPLSHGPAASLAALLHQLEHSQWLDAATIRAHQLRQLGLLAGHCAAHSPFFAARLAAAGLGPADLATPGGLERLPVLERRQLQGAQDLFCDRVPDGHAPIHEARTSGSTGEPVSIRRTEINQFVWTALTLRDQFWHKRDLKGRLCAIRANVDKIERFPRWGGVVGELFETGELLVVPITLPVRELIELVDDFRPESLLAYPNVIAAMVEECRARGYGFEGLRHLRSVGETLPASLRDEAEEVLGARPVDCYSSQEIGYLALECPDAPLHHIMSETVIVELLRDDGSPCEEGEMGRVVVTDLGNFATPMIRYDIGDFAEPGPACPCGRGLPTLKRMVGRERNLLRLADGRRHWPVFGGRDFRDVAPVRQFQAIQHSFDRIEMRLVCERPLTADEADDLRAMIGKALGHDFIIELTYSHGRLPTGPNGKFEEFVCRIEAP
jgi:phenylacetate-CoA ligase